MKIRSLILVLVVLFLWIVMFVLGATTPSARFVEADGFSSAGNFFGFFLCWTWTNVLVLSCLASFLGELTREVVENNGEPAVPRAGIVRGFFIFLAAVSGQLVIEGQVSLPQQLMDAGAAVVSPGQYFRVATSCSLFAFMFSVQPGKMRAILGGGQPPERPAEDNGSNSGSG